MSRAPILPVFLLCLGLLGCAAPEASVYVKGSSHAAAAAPVRLGTNAVGEECTEQAAAGLSAEIFCGDWKEPSAHVRAGGAATDDALDGLATSGAWRNGIDQRFVCEGLVSTSILGGQKALQMQCTSRVGGWPYVALVVQAKDRAWYADGVLSSVPMMYREIGVLSGLVKPTDDTPSSAALSLLAGRMAATAVKSGDIAKFDDLINAATWSNRGDSQGSAVDGLRGALKLQEQSLLPNRNDPHTATTLMALALLLSDQGTYAEADALFARAAVLAPLSPDLNAQAMLLYYRGLDAKNRGNLPRAMDLLTQADAAYMQRVQQTDPDALRDTSAAGPRLLSLYGPGRGVSIASRDLAVNPGSQGSQSALLGLIEVRRNRALVLRALGQLDESDRAVASATGLARANGFNVGLTQDMVRADLYRTSAMTASLNGKPTVALADLRASSVAFRPRAARLQVACRHRLAARAGTDAHGPAGRGPGGLPGRDQILDVAASRHPVIAAGAVPGCLRRRDRGASGPAAASDRRDVHRGPAGAGRHHSRADRESHCCLSGEYARPASGRRVSGPQGRACQTRGALSETRSAGGSRRRGRCDPDGDGAAG